MNHGGIGFSTKYYRVIFYFLFRDSFVRCARKKVLNHNVICESVWYYLVGFQPISDVMVHETLPFDHVENLSPIRQAIGQVMRSTKRYNQMLYINGTSAAMSLGSLIASNTLGSYVV